MPFRTKNPAGRQGQRCRLVSPGAYARGIGPCIPPKSNRKIEFPFDNTLYKSRYKIENMFGKFKDWRRIHTRYDRSAQTFMSAIATAATVIFWINQGA
ncbi:hypothetical protein OEG84_03810 [Hoeflea sp. G2-23]|uniref:Transposase DDE domain-containing protein n=1 Tax=Hoeflea algicola TaxID=2983763 RepID=A0ABT3Z518_9HYPH|nr:transposase [Hoeflea algicola]MCY0146863.1 hypothetical protein [Hoeflea algicola]